MRNETVARRYAVAIFSLAKEAGDVEQTGRSLQVAYDALERNDDAQRFFVSPVIDRAQKAKVLGAALDGKINDIVMNALLLLVRKRREALLEPIVQAFHELALEDKGKEPLEIVTARSLAPGELDELVARLSRIHQTTFEVKARVDPTVLGGIRITMGDRRIDGTVAGRLAELAQKLFTQN